MLKDTLADCVHSADGIAPKQTCDLCSAGLAPAATSVMIRRKFNKAITYGKNQNQRHELVS